MDAPMLRMRGLLAIAALSATLGIVEGLAAPARADLIRARSSHAFPKIAGDIVGAQTYTYDPSTHTGTFEVTNAPHVLKIGPGLEGMVRMAPDQKGALTQSLLMTLDRNGRLIDRPENRFEIRGTVVIGDKTYEGLLLSGRPRAFGAAVGVTGTESTQLFDLDLKITGGALAEAFGREAYLRIMPREGSTFSGQFDVDFSSERPLTSLRAVPDELATPVPEPSTLILLLTVGVGAVGIKLRRRLRPRRSAPAEHDLSACSSTVSLNQFGSRKRQAD